MLRYIPVYDENDDAIDPTFFLQAAGDFAGEISGGLDRDNLPANTIASSEIDATVGNVFNDVQAFSTEDAYAPEMTVTGWQGGAGTTTGTTNLGILSWTATQDGHYDIHWSGEWSWNGAYSWVTAGARPDRTDTFDTMRIRVVVDGDPVCMAGPFEDGMIYGSTYMIGSIQLPAGPHTLRVQCEVARRIAQDGELDGQCTNTITFADRTILAIGRVR